MECGDEEFSRNRIFIAQLLLVKFLINDLWWIACMIYLYVDKVANTPSAQE